MKERYEHMSDSDKRYLREISRYCTKTKATKIAGVQRASGSRYCVEQSVDIHQAHFCYPALVANGYRLVQRRPKPVWKKGAIEAVLDADYMPESITYDGEEVYFTSPCWTIGDMEDAVRRHNDDR